jgi:hypothetical protein
VQRWCKKVFRLGIRLENVDPPVWRRVLVPGGAKLSRLHDIIPGSDGMDELSPAPNTGSGVIEPSAELKLYFGTLDNT